MTDQQVIYYIKAEYGQGTNQQAIGVALSQKGVTRDQMERVKRQVEQQNQTGSITIEGDKSIAVMRASHADEVIVRNIEIHAFQKWKGWNIISTKPENVRYTLEKGKLISHI